MYLEIEVYDLEMQDGRYIPCVFSAKFPENEEEMIIWNKLGEALKEIHAKRCGAAVSSPAS